MQYIIVTIFFDQKNLFFLDHKFQFIFFLKKNLFPINAFWAFYLMVSVESHYYYYCTKFEIYLETRQIEMECLYMHRQLSF